MTRSGPSRRTAFRCVGLKQVVNQGRVREPVACRRTVKTEHSWCGQCIGHRVSLDAEAAQWQLTGSEPSPARVAWMQTHPDPHVRRICVLRLPAHLLDDDKVTGFVSDDDVDVRHALWAQRLDLTFSEPQMLLGVNDSDETVAAAAAHAAAAQQADRGQETASAVLRAAAASHWSPLVRIHGGSLVPDGAAPPTCGDVDVDELDDSPRPEPDARLVRAGTALADSDIVAALRDPAGSPFGCLVAAVNTRTHTADPATRRRHAAFMARAVCAAATAATGTETPAGMAVLAHDAAAAVASQDADHVRLPVVALRDLAVGCFLCAAAAYRSAEPARQDTRTAMFTASMHCLQRLTALSRYGIDIEWDKVIEAWLPAAAAHAAAHPSVVQPMLSRPLTADAICCAAAGPEAADAVCAALLEASLTEAVQPQTYGVSLTLNNGIAGPVTVAAMAAHRRPDVKAAAVHFDADRHPTKRMLTDRTLHEMARSKSYSLQMAIARSRHADPRTLERLVSSSHLAVRYAVAAHPRASDATLLALAFDDDAAGIAKLAAGRLAARRHEAQEAASVSQAQRSPANRSERIADASTTTPGVHEQTSHI